VAIGSAGLHRAFQGLKFRSRVGCDGGRGLLLVVGIAHFPACGRLSQGFFWWNSFGCLADPRPEPSSGTSLRLPSWLQLLVPFKILTWLLGKEIIRAGWSRGVWVKVLYMYMASYLIAPLRSHGERSLFCSIWGFRSVLPVCGLPDLLLQTRV